MRKHVYNWLQFKPKYQPIWIATLISENLAVRCLDSDVDEVGLDFIKFCFDGLCST